jgi:tetratricopeptide (TPR) repeat protein
MEEINQLLVQAQEAYNNGRLDDVMIILQDELLNDNLQALFLKGEAYYKLQKWGDALNCFSLYLEKDPLDVRVKSYIQMIQNILGFHHKDIFNP